MFQASLHEDAVCWVEDQAKLAMKGGLIFSCDALEDFSSNGFGYNTNGIMKSDPYGFLTVLFFFILSFDTSDGTPLVTRET